MAESVDARDLKSLEGNLVRVRVPPSAPNLKETNMAEKSITFDFSGRSITVAKSDRNDGENPRIFVVELETSGIQTINENIANFLTTLMQVINVNTAFLNLNRAIDMPRMDGRIYFFGTKTKFYVTANDSTANN